MTRARDLADTQDNLGGAVPPVTAGKNAIINGAFDFWQRGTSVAKTGSGGTSADYTADRWVAGGSGGTSTTTSRQATNDTTNLPFIQYCGRFQRTAGNADTSTVYFAQILETVNSIPLAGKTVTVSYYARAGANYSSASSSLNALLGSGTGTDQAFFAFTGTATVAGTSVTLTTTWQRFTMTGTVATNATQLRLYYSYGPTGTAGANDYFEITGVQVEVGSVATPFSRATGTIQGELAACQRYYVRTTPGTAFGYLSNTGSAISTTVSMNAINVATMRTVPTSLDYANIALTADDANVTAITSAAINNNSSANQVIIKFTVASGLTQYRPYWVLANNNVGAYIGLGAEL